MASAVFPSAELYAMINDWVSGETSGCDVFLFDNDITPTINSDFSDFTEPTASWYSRKSATLFQPYDLGDGSFQLSTQSVQWDYSGSDATDTIYGCGLVSASPYTLLCSHRFETAKVMGAVPDAVPAAPTLNFVPQPGD